MKKTIKKVTNYINLSFKAAGILCILNISCQAENGKIDRYALVNRHKIMVEAFDSLASLTVGNGNFAFTTDITGLQTFYKEYENGVSLGTMSNWGWHTIPNTEGFDISETYLYHDVAGREVPYEHQQQNPERAVQAVNYFRENPHRLHLGIIRLVITKQNGQEISMSDVKNPKHQLDMWRGEISGSFNVEGTSVNVITFVHPEQDIVTARIESPLIASGQLAVEWLFPYGVPSHTHAGYDFNAPDKHHSDIEKSGDSSASIVRTLDDNTYYAAISWNGKAEFGKAAEHRFLLTPASGQKAIEFSCRFSPDPLHETIPTYKKVKKANESHWPAFWETGGAVDFSECTDPRATELERRTVLSQYVTKINGSGNLPPQETGLTFNSWYGKFHLEMIWWHSAHYYNWQRSEYMTAQLDYYHDIYQKALEFTKLQGYNGVRWPKMVGPEGQNSPSSIGSYLIWQQPHLIYLAEQLYLANPSVKILEEYAGLVFATAEFMADFPVFDKKTGRYNLAPPLIPAQEHWNRETTMNPPFELAYWHLGLTIAQKWNGRLGKPVNKKWEKVLDNLPDPSHNSELYMGIANAPDSYTNPQNMKDHPMVLGTLGMLPHWEKVDEEIMRNTLKFIMEHWDWPQTWGWDFPMVAMCATRLSEPDIALDALLMDAQKNTYLVNGHNYQDERLRIYLPGNGGLLKAIALMCAGWEGNAKNNPGFPDDGTWNVKWENLNPDF